MGAKDAARTPHTHLKRIKGTKTSAFRQKSMKPALDYSLNAEVGYGEALALFFLEAIA
jgi:hypothetical protein